MILNIYKHVYDDDEHAELKVGDTVKLKKSRCGNWMCVLKWPWNHWLYTLESLMTIRINQKNSKMRVDFLNP
jgi:hypothetical protein